MATKWVGHIKCVWCGGQERVGIEKDGEGRCYRLICNECSVVEQIARDRAAGKMVSELLNRRTEWQ